MPTGVIANHHLVPDPHVLLAGDQDQSQAANFSRLGVPGPVLACATGSAK